MLREIEGVTDEPRTRRRWFHDDYFDLFVWQTEQGDITLFQLCYGIAPAEKALVWHRAGGFFHDGAGSDSRAADVDIAERFEASAQSVPQNIRKAVAERIREYLDGRLPAATRRKQFRRENWQKAAAP